MRKRNSVRGIRRLKRILLGRHVCEVQGDNFGSVAKLWREKRVKAKMAMKRTCGQESKNW